MPIRMVDDPRDPDENSGDDSGGGGNGFSDGGDGGGGLFGILLLLLGLFRGRGLILIILLAVIGYFFLGRGGCHGIGGSGRFRDSSKSPSDSSFWRSCSKSSA